ncbi:MAG TPA: hypothetical protein VKM54_10650 [Myxococcota bacterium]|nr:hypothetical protein [Myxococcota bacterium]
MKVLLIMSGLSVALVVFVTAFGIDEGEVVNLSTVDARGAQFETQLWIIEQDGKLYLRAGRPAARWLARLRAHPEVKIERGGTTTPYRAVPLDDPATREAVNRGMAEKYGQADGLIARIFDRSQTVPIRLEPLGPGKRSGSAHAPPEGAAR